MVTDDHEKPEISHGYRTPVARNRCVVSGRSRRRGFGYVRKLPSGRWQASYLGPDLVRRSAPHTFDAKADAEGWLGRRREEVVSGEWQPPVRVEQTLAHAECRMVAQAADRGVTTCGSSCWIPGML